MNTGIYQIRNILNNKLYIGSAAGKGFQNRWQFHLADLKKDKHHSSKLQNAWNKYGEESFVFEVLEECVPEKCIEREQYYLDFVKPEYNCRPIANSQLGFKHSKATKLHLSKIKTGLKHSIESKLLMSQKRIGKYTGEANSHAKLTIKQVKVIKRALRIGISQKKLAIRFGVNTQAISKINTGQRWSDIK